MTGATLYRAQEFRAPSGNILHLESQLSVRPENGESFTLHELYSLLKCRTVEVVRLNDDSILIVDEEGKLVDEPILNRAATAILRQSYPGTDDWCAGNILHCPDEMLK